jgi:hypothetical protein
MVISVLSLRLSSGVAHNPGRYYDGGGALKFLILTAASNGEVIGAR